MRSLVVLGMVAALVIGLVLNDGEPPTVQASQPTEVELMSSSSSSLVVATFNLLGHGHTEPGGKFAWMGSGPVRLKNTSRLLQRHAIDVVGLQEVHPPQYKLLPHVLSAYSYYPGPGVAQRNKQNVVAWKKSRFSLVRGTSVLIPYKRGRLVPMPVVKLRDKGSGKTFWTVTVHNAPGKTAKARASRAKALTKQVALTNQLLATGSPVFMTGDMNDRVGYFCRYTASGAMVAAAGGYRTATRCEPPPARRAQIDWVFGPGKDVSFSGYRFDRSPLVRRTSDHPLVLARATWRR
jgi:endonuclease/exonuclease/phosphatase family metal-dependent hydrolase